VTAAPAALARGTLHRDDIAILPFMAVMPFMYAPKVLEGDTQPWMMLVAILAFFWFRPAIAFNRRDLSLIVLAMLCILAFVLRSASIFDSIRSIYTFGVFILLWTVVQRENGDYFHKAIRYVIVVWFAAGFYQYLAINLDLPVSFAGRYVEGRSGVPSLTSEPSTYGSLSMIQMMYLIKRGQREDHPFILIAALSVLLSGSLLAMLLLTFPLMQLRWRLKILAVAMLLVLLTIDRAINVGGISARIADLGSPEDGLLGILVDPSLNLRLGHIIYTLYINFWPSLFFQSGVNFEELYNDFAASSIVFIDTGSNFILTSLGELVFGSGIFGLALFVNVAFRAQKLGHGIGSRMMRVVFILACMLNPITLSNAFLIIYALQKEKS
jgi:hypothetical protein